jgi:hypothetical protein
VAFDLSVPSAAGAVVLEPAPSASAAVGQQLVGAVTEPVTELRPQAQLRGITTQTFSDRRRQGPGGSLTAQDGGRALCRRRAEVGLTKSAGQAY